MLSGRTGRIALLVGALVLIVGLAVVGQVLGWWTGVGGQLSGAVGADGRGSDPLTSFMIQLDCNGGPAGYFTQFWGLGSSSEVVEHKVVTGPGVEQMLQVPGRLSWQSVTLRRGLTANRDIWDWRALVEAGEVDQARVNCALTVFDQEGGAVAAWALEKAWPVSVTVVEPQDGQGVVLEEILLVHEGATRTQ